MDFYTGAFLYIVIVLSAVFHEYAHGLAAEQLGDDTARQAGRLTLNPFAHLDLVGTVLLPLLFIFTPGFGFFIGWAKPVPYNPYNLRDKKYGSLKVALAGPASNIIIAIVLGVIIRIAMPFSLVSPLAIQLIAFVAYINIVLAIFNLIPVPPLDGSKVLFDLVPSAGRTLGRLGFIGIALALIIAFYVLAPIAQIVFYIITGAHVGAIL